MCAQIAFMPTLILAARLCPVGVKGALFATLMSIFNGGSAMGSELGEYNNEVIWNLTYSYNIFL